MCFAFRTDATKDDRLGTLTSSQCGLVELAALVFYRVLGFSICCLVFQMMLSAIPFVCLSSWNLIIYNILRIMCHRVIMLAICEAPFPKGMF